MPSAVDPIWLKVSKFADVVPPRELLDVAIQDASGLILWNVPLCARFSIAHSDSRYRWCERRHAHVL